MDRYFLKKIILENNLLDEKKLKELETLSLNSNIPFLSSILNGKYISATAIMPLLAKAFHLEWLNIEPNDNRLQKILYLQLPDDLRLETEILPLFKENNFIIVGVSNPINIELIDGLKHVTNWNIKLVLMTQNALDGIREIFTSDKEREKLDELFSLEIEEKSIEDIANEAPVIKMVNLIIMQAISLGASDIHIEPYEKDAVIRYRVDGVLKESSRYNKKIYPAVISRIKIMADLNIAERRIPQDGRITLNLMEKNYDLRVATIPVLHGEGIVIRILDKGGNLVNLEQIGFSTETLEHFRKQISLPHGIILVTGPTGSGKTTTLNAALVSIKNFDSKIITIEDPVEFEVPGITQIHVNPKVGLTFATGLRSILRLDPDIVMVGEIRDSETAEIAIRTALTGHLVFSTLHTNDAPSAITRLIDMGIEPFLISSSVNAILAQRLLRKVCKFCGKDAEPTTIAKTLFNVANIEIPKTLIYGQGCDECNSTGYSGRIAIIEFFEFSEKLRELTNRRVSTELLKKEAINAGMKTMRDDGIQKILSGITTAEEVLRVTQMD